MKILVADVARAAAAPVLRTVAEVYCLAELRLVSSSTPKARRISYDVVRRRHTRIATRVHQMVLRSRSIRMPAQTARGLVASFGGIESNGGVAAASQAAFAAPGRDARLVFMLEFDGIGDKFPRRYLDGTCTVRTSPRIARRRTHQKNPTATLRRRPPATRTTTIH